MRFFIFYKPTFGIAFCDAIIGEYRNFKYDTDVHHIISPRIWMINNAKRGGVGLT